MRRHAILPRWEHNRIDPGIPHRTAAEDAPKLGLNEGRPSKGSEVMLTRASKKPRSMVARSGAREDLWRREGQRGGRIAPGPTRSPSRAAVFSLDPDTSPAIQGEWKTHGIPKRELPRCSVCLAGSWTHPPEVMCQCWISPEAFVDTRTFRVLLCADAGRKRSDVIGRLWGTGNTRRFMWAESGWREVLQRRKNCPRLAQLRYSGNDDSRGSRGDASVGWASCFRDRNGTQGAVVELQARQNRRFGSPVVQGGNG